MTSYHDLDSLKLWPIQPVLTPRRAGPLISGRTLGVYTPIGVYTRLGFCAPLGFCTPLGFCALLGFCTAFDWKDSVYVRWISAYVPLTTSILPRNRRCPASFLPRIIVIPLQDNQCQTLYPSTPNKSTSQDGVVITSSGPDAQIPRYYLLVTDLIYTKLHILFLPLLATKTRGLLTGTW